MVQAVTHISRGSNIEAFLNKYQKSYKGSSHWIEQLCKFEHLRYKWIAN